MIFKHLAHRRVNTLTNSLQALISARKLLLATKQLATIDSIELDNMCESVLAHYSRKAPSLKKKDRNKIAQDQQAQNEQYIKFLYDALSETEVGFLKGDIHSQLVFKLNKHLLEKNPKQLDSDLEAQESKKILNMVTDIKTFRFPRRDVKSSEEDKKNIYQRQLLLEVVSNEQANEKFDNILDSLEKVGKIHLTDAFKKYLVEWFPPLCSAIKEEQAKCRDEKQLDGKRKIYYEVFSRLPPEKMALLCLSELLKAITSILYKDYSRELSQQPEWEDEKDQDLQEFDCIRYKNLCITLARWVSIQEVYEEKQKQFKTAMREYDGLSKQRKQEKIDLVKKYEEERLKQKMFESDEHEDGENEGGSPHEKIESLVNEMFATQPPMTDIEAEQKIQKKVYADKLKQIQAKYNQRYVSPQDRKSFLQQIANQLMREHYKFKSSVSEEVQYEIGCLLIYLMKQILKTQNKSGHRVPLLTLEYKYFKRNGETLCDKRLKINDHFLNTILPVIEKEGDLFMHLDRSVPTIIEPLPWVSYEIGGYFMNPSTIMRFSHCKVQERLIKYSDLNRVYNVLNYLSTTPWKINKKVLAVVESLWEEGGEVGQIPKRYSQLQTPYLTRIKFETNFHKQKQLKKQIQKIRDEHSMRGDFDLKLNIARSFSKMDRFYYPHNLDFRGRVYPVPPHLNHIGNDLSRGLLLFAQGKKLGQGGLRWLKIHCANLMGKDKAQLHEKVEYIEANLGLVFAIAQKPLQNREWLQYEDCWQALGAIIQLSDALKSDHPEEFVSYLHVHQDGSCNGLQHYAALGKDSEGAYQVNLGPTEKPGDVYTHVAKMVIKMIDNDVANTSSPFHELAKRLSGNIKRKTVKQTVMTSVYGVTFIGARQQIHRQLKDQNFLKDDDEQYKASIYLAKYTLDAISNLFSSAHHIKKWLISCAKAVAQNGNPIGWITPMGLPVVQPYRKQTNLDMINTIIHSLKLSKRSQNLPVNKSKQQSAFPPNFVHSLDSTHMMFTAEKCKDQGISFAAVHDSYWTHAGTIETMNHILREEFVKLHSMPLLQNLKKSLEMRYPLISFPEIPDKGDFDLNKILESKYFFS